MAKKQPKRVNAKLKKARKTKINPYGQIILTEKEHKRARERYDKGLKKVKKTDPKRKVPKGRVESFARDSDSRGLILSQTERRSGIKRYNTWKRKVRKSGRDV